MRLNAFVITRNFIVIILLFQEGKAPVINEDGNTYRYFGTSISEVPNSPK